MPTDTTAEPGQAVAVRQPREIRVVQDHVAIFDTAKFEHFGRIATVMAESGMMPDSLRTYKAPNEAGVMTVYELPDMAQKARAFMITELADRLDFSPFGLMGSCSFVHGKLMVEGKVVHAAIEHKLGIALEYLFGTWIPADERTDLERGEGAGDLLGVVVRGILPGETEPREIHGSVGIWKTTGSGSPWRPGSMKRQCRYRGAREWERAFHPGTLLGVLSEDEVDFSQVDAPAPRAARVKTNLREKLSGPTAEAGGFDAEHMRRETPHDPETGEVVDEAQAEVVQPGHAPVGDVYMMAGDGVDKDGNTPVYRDGKQIGVASQEAARPLKTFAEHAPEVLPGGKTQADGAKAVAEREATKLAPSDDVQEGVAGPGEAYFLAADREVDPKGKRATYKDGKPFSRASADNVSFMVYDDHSPEVEAKPAAGESKSPASSEGSRESDEPVAIIPWRAEWAAGEGIPAGPMAEFWAHMVQQTSWLAIKAELGKLNGSDDFNELEPDEQAAMRARIWSYVEHLRANHRDPVTPAEDASAFRIWLCTQTGAQGARAAAKTFAALQQSKGWGKLKPEQQSAFGKIVSDHITKERDA
jgi:hypothetical protein